MPGLSLNEQSPTMTPRKVTSYIAKITSLALLSLLLYVIYQTLDLYLTGPKAPDSVHPEYSHHKPTSTATETSSKEWNIFGELSPSPLTPPPPKKQKTKANISLTGIFFDNIEDEGYGIIKMDEKNEKPYKAGSQISQDIKLIKISQNHVLLEENGALVELYLDDPADFYKASDDPTVTTDQPTDSPQDLRSKVLASLKLEPVSKTEPKGYRVTSGSTAIINKYGLKAGDVIVSANGYPLGDAISDDAAIKSFQDIGEAVFLVQQDSSTTQFTYDKNSLVSQ